jgi:DNA-binding transcriptional regulator/RsmH inhibitor MraZ
MRLLPWAMGDPVRAKLEDLASSSGEEVEDALLLLHDRYQRLVLDQDARLDLPGHVANHLQIADPAALFLARYRDRVELWSTAYREARLSRAARSFPDLP